MTGDPVVSVLSSRSSEIPGASDPGAGQTVKVKMRCLDVKQAKGVKRMTVRVF